MAYIGRGVPTPGYLQIINSTTATFTATSTTGAATVGFHLVDTSKNTFSSSPTANLCGGKTYVIAVSTGTTQNSVKMLADPVPLGSINYSLVDPPTSLSTAGLQTLVPNTSSINLAVPFAATLVAGPDTYILQSSPNNVSVGYTTPLTNPLSNCSACGCNTGSVCQTNGTCTTLCGPNSECVGACKGNCPFGYECTADSTGNHSCVSITSTTSWWFWIAVGAFIFLLIVLLLFAFIYSGSSSPTPVKVAEPVKITNTTIPNTTTPPLEYTITQVPGSAYKPYKVVK